MLTLKTDPLAATNDIAVIEQVLETCASQHRTADARTFTVFDETRGHFFVVEEGWIGGKHLYNPFVHVEARDGTVWVQQDYTNHGIANDLARSGIARSRIVLGYRAPSERNDVEFAATGREELQATH